MVVLLLAVPSLNGVLAYKRLRRSFEGLTVCVKPKSGAWRSIEPSDCLGTEGVALRPENFLRKKEKPTETAALPLAHGEVLKLKMSVALTKKPPGEWIFWPSGICETVVGIKGRDGTWTASSALTARAESGLCCEIEDRQSPLPFMKG